MGFFEFLTGIFITLENDNIVLYCMMIALFICTITIGPYTWVYIGEIGNEKSQSFGLLFAQGLVQSFTITYVIDYIGPNYTFWLFSGCCFIAAILLCIFMKETKGLTQDQTKVLYVPDHLLNAQRGIADGVSKKGLQDSEADGTDRLLTESNRRQE